MTKMNFQVSRGWGFFPRRSPRHSPTHLAAIRANALLWIPIRVMHAERDHSRSPALHVNRLWGDRCAPKGIIPRYVGGCHVRATLTDCWPERGAPAGGYKGAAAGAAAREKFPTARNLKIHFRHWGRLPDGRRQAIALLASAGSDAYAPCRRPHIIPGNSR